MVLKSFFCVEVNEQYVCITCYHEVQYSFYQIVLIIFRSYKNIKLTQFTSQIIPSVASVCLIQISSLFSLLCLIYIIIVLLTLFPFLKNSIQLSKSQISYWLYSVIHESSSPIVQIEQSPALLYKMKDVYRQKRVGIGSYISEKWVGGGKVTYL